jgi:hypothetical protein
MTETFHKTVDIKTVDEEARTATGAVLVPNELDHQHDFLRPDAVERFHADSPDTGVMHSAFPNDAAELERNEVIDESEAIGDETFPPGTWVATRRYEDDDLWQLVNDGVLTGFSIGGEISRAAEHDELPSDVRVPDSVDHEGGGTELLAGQVNEVSDVDIPAVPRASYKGDGLGKALLDEVDGEAEFVELMVEQRGHEESDARELYQYLTDVRETKRRDVLDKVGKPFESPQGAEFEDFEDCVATLLSDDADLDRAEAEEICGAWEEQDKNKVEVNGETVDLTPPEAVVNAAEAALEAKREQYPDEIGDCGTGVGESRAERIIANNLRPEDFVGGENTAIPDYLDSHSEDVADYDEPPTDWGRDQWLGIAAGDDDDPRCGPVQFALWGGTATGTALEWANTTEQELRDAMETESMTDTDDGIDDATKLQVIKSWLTGSDDSEQSGEALDAAKATDDDEDDEDDEDEMDDDKSADMTNDDTQSDPPEWAKSLTDTVEQIDERVDKLEGDDDEDAEKAMDDAPEWAQDLAEKVDDLDERVDAISKQSGHSQQLDATENNADDTDDEVDTFKAGLVGGR